MLVSYFLNNAAKTWLYALIISKNIEIEHVFHSKVFFHLTSNLHTSCFSTFNLNRIKPWCVNYNQHIQKTKNKLCMKAINYAYSKLEEKATRSVKNDKNNFINLIGYKFNMSIRWENLAILFCKKLFSCINYLQLQSNWLIHWLFPCTQEVQSFNVFWSKLISRNTSHLLLLVESTNLNNKVFLLQRKMLKTPMMMMAQWTFFEAYIISDVKGWRQSSQAPSCSLHLLLAAFELWRQPLTSLTT